MQSDTNDRKFAGMTVNERLFAAGVLSRWDDACRRRDRQSMIEVLCEVEFSAVQAASTVDQTLAHPEVYLRHLGPA
jgi:hypothetical protein